MTETGQVREGALHNIHASAAASMGEFSGWHMPAVYSGVDREYEAARERTAMADLSHFGRLAVKGKDRLELLHRLSTNDLLGLSAGQIGETLLLNDRGRLIDSLEVWVRDDSLLLRVSPGNETVVRHWIEKYTITEEIEVTDITGSTGEITLVGPQAESVISAVYGAHAAESVWTSVHAPEGELLIGSVKQDKTLMVRLMAENPLIVQTWRSILSAAAGAGVRQMGLTAYDAYRISLGIPAIGREITDSYNPYDAGLRKSISFTKGCYIGQEVVARLDTYQKVRRRPMGLVLTEGCTVGRERAGLRKGEEEAGWLTSAMNTRVRGKYIGLGIVNVSNVREGDRLEVNVNNVLIQGVALNLPLLL